MLIVLREEYTAHESEPFTSCSLSPWLLKSGCENNQGKCACSNSLGILYHFLSWWLPYFFPLGNRGFISWWQERKHEEEYRVKRTFLWYEKRWFKPLQSWLFVFGLHHGPARFPEGFSPPKEEWGQSYRVSRRGKEKQHPHKLKQINSCTT